MTDNVVEERLDSLTGEIRFLQSRLDNLTERFDDLESALSVNSGRTVPIGAPEEESYAPFPEIDSDKVFSWMGTSSLLPRIAAICFILVFALVLRTLTDNDVIGKQLGSYIGMGYAAVLVGWGIRLLARQSRLASVFFVSGILLMYSIAWETHVRFESVSSLSVFLILIILLALSSMISIRFHHGGINSLAILGTSLLAIVIDLPNPAFVPLILLFLVANLMAYISAKKLGRGEWNRFIVFGLTVCVCILWVFKLQAAMTIGNVPLTPELAVQWYLPAILVFALTFLGISIHRFSQAGEASILDFLFPAANALWSYPLAHFFITSAGGRVDLLGYCGIAAGLIHFGIALLLYRKEQAGGPAICSFTTGGSFFLLLSLPSAFGGILPAIPAWALIAFGMARISEACEIGGIRLTSYFIPVLACILGIASGSFAVDTQYPIITMIVTGFLALMSGGQYYWCRNNPISCKAGYFAEIDRSDRTGVVLLAVSLVSGFCMLQIASFQILASFPGDSANVLKGIQSILINAGAVLLLLLAIRSRNKEIIGVAAVVIVIGALKVFGYDLFKAYGVPLVMSVLSFGVAAAVGSMVMGRWFQWSRSPDG